MSALTRALLWSPVQVTVLALAAIAIGAIVGRRRPSAGALVAAATLVAMVGLTAAALSPWPAWDISWEWLPKHHPIAAGDGKPEQPAIAATANLSAQTFDDPRDFEQPLKGRSTTGHEPAGLLDRDWNQTANDWAMLAVVLYLAGVALLALRIALGLLAVRGYRRHSHPITDRALNELADVVGAELRCKTGIELRESTRIGTPATIGWLRPMLLLPADWRTWTGDERQAVLAHEIEHVRRNDFAFWMVAQLGVALHFYHPLVHGLANRLRLQQELAADAAAARVVGGQRKYVSTLAAMALRQADQPLAWPASAFIPNSKTFVRRIEMLHRSKPLRGDVSRPVVFLSVAAVLLTAMCAAGIRGSVAGEQVAATGSTGENGAFSGTEVALNQAAEPPKAAVPPMNPLRQQAFRVQTVNHLKQLALAMHNYHDKNGHFPPAVVMGPDGKTPHSWRVELLPYLDKQALYDHYRLDEPWDSENNKKVLEQIPEVFTSPFNNVNSNNSGYYVLVGPGTVFEGAGGVRIRDIVDGTSNTLMLVEAKRNIPWTKPEDIPFDPKKPLPELGGFVKGQFTAALADGSVHTYSVDKAKDQLKLLIMRNDLQVIDFEKLGDGSNRVGVQQPRPVAPRRPVGKAARARDNLKQLMLAMHNYHDVHRHFPPAVVMGPDGKTPHSWRVELLPFLDQEALFKQYRLNEPWDSENNKKVLAKMPEQFRSPYDDPKSLNSGYYALVGPGTMFDGTEGIQIQNVTDGTSNTLMIVEAKRNIPWTKPEDIPFDPEKSPPDLGGFVEGGFNCAFADGSAHSLETARVKDELKWLIMRNDGHVITTP
ncbi:MAG TPA: M56 family metallopeptidase [Planctomycetaceae bacterium]|jgi:beta-lactamase regulating signal transducer with metallopeptidase domain|nr:M56 family metallopeptidase [Planctomycetaceae bacterium]